jgi:lysozyme
MPDGQQDFGGEEMKKLNETGLELVKKSEGLRLEKYQDVAGKWTIGYGHLIKKRETFDGPITEERATELLEQDLQLAESAVDELVSVSLNDNQYGALVDFVYNVGKGNFEASTLLKRLNSGKYTAAANEFLKWVYAGGRRVEGLARRRAAERALFLNES